MNYFCSPGGSPKPQEPPVDTSWSDQPGAVTHLSTADFNTFLQDKYHSLIMFYAPWCGHCKKAKPEFQQAFNDISQDENHYLAAVDCTINQGINFICKVYIKYNNTYQFTNCLNIFDFSHFPNQNIWWLPLNMLCLNQI